MPCPIPALMRNTHCCCIRSYDTMPAAVAGGIVVRRAARIRFLKIRFAVSSVELHQSVEIMLLLRYLLL